MIHKQCKNKNRKRSIPTSRHYRNQSSGDKENSVTKYKKNANQRLQLKNDILSLLKCHRTNLSLVNIDITSLDSSNCKNLSCEFHYNHHQVIPNKSRPSNTDKPQKIQSVIPNIESINNQFFAERKKKIREPSFNPNKWKLRITRKGKILKWNDKWGGWIAVKRQPRKGETEKISKLPGAPLTIKMKYWLGCEPQIISIPSQYVHLPFKQKGNQIRQATLHYVDIQFYRGHLRRPDRLLNTFRVYPADRKLLLHTSRTGRSLRYFMLDNNLWINDFDDYLQLVSDNIFEGIKPLNWSPYDIKWNNSVGIVEHDIRSIILEYTDHVFDNIPGLIMMIDRYFERKIYHFEMNGQVVIWDDKISDNDVLAYEIKRFGRKTEEFMFLKDGVYPMEKRSFCLRNIHLPGVLSRRTIASIKRWGCPKIGTLEYSRSWWMRRKRIPHACSKYSKCEPKLILSWSNKD